MRRRRAETLRAEGRRRLRRILVGVGTAACAAGCLAVLHSPLLAVRRVAVSGNTHTPAAAVLAAAGLAPGDPPVPMVDVDTPARADAVEALPWVGHVAFHRNWPWGVVVAVYERRPVAVVDSGGVVEAIDASGRVLELVGSGGPGSVARELRARDLPPLPVLVGVRGASAGGYIMPVPGTTAQGVVAMESAAPLVAAPVAARGLTLRYSASGGLSATVGGSRASVLLGGTGQMATKLAVLAELERHVPLSAYSLVDLTVPLRPTLATAGNPGPNGGNG